MVAWEQMKFVEGLVARFERRSREMVSLELVQAQYIAIITMLRGVGHTFRKIDCVTKAQESWADEMWKTWKQEPIFAKFIEPTRNDLLKEFHGGLNIGNDAFVSLAVFADPGMSGGRTIVGAFDPARLVDDQGDPTMPKIHEGLAFWKRRLGEAQTAFQAFPR